MSKEDKKTFNLQKAGYISGVVLVVVGLLLVIFAVPMARFGVMSGLGNYGYYRTSEWDITMVSYAIKSHQITGIIVAVSGIVIEEASIIYEIIRSKKGNPQS